VNVLQNRDTWSISWKGIVCEIFQSPIDILQLPFAWKYCITKYSTSFSWKPFLPVQSFRKRQTPESSSLRGGGPCCRNRHHHDPQGKPPSFYGTPRYISVKSFPFSRFWRLPNCVGKESQLYLFGPVFDCRGNSMHRARAAVGRFRMTSDVFGLRWCCAHDNHSHWLFIYNSYLSILKCHGIGTGLSQHNHDFNFHFESKIPPGRSPHNNSNQRFLKQVSLSFFDLIRNGTSSNALFWLLFEKRKTTTAWGS